MNKIKFVVLLSIVIILPSYATTPLTKSTIQQQCQLLHENYTKLSQQKDTAKQLADIKKMASLLKCKQF